jgi:hypothetical protein
LHKATSRSTKNLTTVAVLCRTFCQYLVLTMLGPMPVNRLFLVNPNHAVNHWPSMLSTVSITVNLLASIFPVREAKFCKGRHSGKIACMQSKKISQLSVKTKAFDLTSSLHYKVLFQTHYQKDIAFFLGKVLIEI